MNSSIYTSSLQNTYIQHLERLLIVALLVLSSSMVASGQADQNRWAPVHPSLLDQIARSDAPVAFLVILDDQPDLESLLDQKQLRSATRQAKAPAIYTYLTTFAKRSQASLLAWLEAQNVSYRPFYIVNAIEVTGDITLITQLRQRADVARIAANPRIVLALPEQTETDAQTDARTLGFTNVADGITYTKAPQVWAQGFRGQGIVIASQDTGVDWRHPALRSKYRGWNAATLTVTHPYNWFDAWGTANRGACDPNPQVPCDDNGHGTHTVGTILGDDDASGDQSLAVGMAPDAKWIGCRNMKVGVGTPGSYIRCFEFFLAPYPQDGDPLTDGRPELAPDIINNSWYCPPSEGCDFDSLSQVVRTIRAAGQMVIASAGNNGPGCATIRYPISAYPEIFSVGAHDNNGLITTFSSRGPVIADGSGRLKPEIVAPGLSVYSTFPDGGYGNLSGTSMASPHVAGAVALIWSAAPHLIGQLEETEQILIKSAVPSLEQSIIDWSYNTEGNLVCQLGLRSPNYTYGYGRLDVAAAVAMALAPSTLSVTLRLEDGQPLADARVTVNDTLTGFSYQGTSDENGAVTFSRIYQGEYTILIEQGGQVKQQSFTVEAGTIAEVKITWIDTTPIPTPTPSATPTSTPIPTATATMTPTPTSTAIPNDIYLPNVLAP